MKCNLYDRKNWLALWIDRRLSVNACGSSRVWLVLLPCWLWPPLSCCALAHFCSNFLIFVCWVILTINKYHTSSRTLKGYLLCYMLYDTVDTGDTVVEMVWIRHYICYDYFLLSFFSFSSSQNWTRTRDNNKTCPITPAPPAPSRCPTPLNPASPHPSLTAARVPHRVLRRVLCGVLESSIRLGASDLHASPSGRFHPHLHPPHHHYHELWTGVWRRGHGSHAHTAPPYAWKGEEGGREVGMKQHTDTRKTEKICHVIVYIFLILFPTNPLESPKQQWITPRNK